MVSLICRIQKKTAELTETESRLAVSVWGVGRDEEMLIKGNKLPAMR